ncbi:MAG: hypothetical protein IBX62_09645 [Coriobacteriia bacterium]|nr:hypothetical protein [Coriobacteriia bacterium]
MTDQDDFFFDEEEKPAEPEKAPARAPSKPASRAAVPAASPSLASQSVTLPVAGLLALCTLLVGVVIGLAVGRPAAVPAPTQLPSIPAPELTPEQLEGGQLPEDHPPIGEVPGSAAPTETPDEGGSDEAPAGD